MRTKSGTTALYAILLMASAIAVAFAGDRSDERRLAEGNAAFAVDLYGQLRAQEGNQFFSPYSVSSALAMTYAGARGNTATEMKDALDFRLDREQLHAAFKSLKQELTANARKDGHKLNIANGLCLTGGDVSGDFKALLKDNYDAEIFSGGLQKINDWVKAKTEGKIEKILEGLSGNSVCVILNAIYFKGDWESPFKKKSTHDAPFKVSAQRQVKVPLMYQKSHFKMLEAESFQGISIPYAGKVLSMVVLLPREVGGLEQLERQLTAQGLEQWLAELDKRHAQDVRLFLPRFKMETDYGLVPAFRALGMTDAFIAGKADFSGMGWPKGKLWISQIKHKAYVEVNEEGTEAAAATAVAMETLAMRPSPVFRADHPFLFLIRDSKTGSILFMGRLTDPRAGE